ncbi:hypothetical protein A7P53_04375 [Acinetobacter defluvii]|uniref:DUF5677 domain-containing protein n=1 Tax=Acinetobacter defluvii TaxID=1871111 RepID=UPI00148FFAC1|nr:DUF5677 domain-containing protein [Acinetobacter defluvii]NNP71704.1 hypothetical protein [Acinetobacter defluvii]
MKNDLDFVKVCAFLKITAKDIPPNATSENLDIMIYQKRISKQLEISKDLLKLATKVSKLCIGDMSIDCAYLSKVTLLRQLNHYKTVLYLAENLHSDTNLISRSMFEGALYFFYLCHDPKMMREWRLYSCVETLKLIDKAKSNGENVPQELLNAVYIYKDEYEKAFKKPNGEFYLSWKKNITIKQMAMKTKHFQHLYNEYYVPLSDYHHWGHASLAYDFQITDDNQDVNVNTSSASLTMITKSLDLANSSIYSLLDASINIFNIGQFVTELKEIMDDLSKIPFAKKRD